MEHLQGRSSTSSRGSLCHRSSPAQHPLPFASLSCTSSRPARLSILPRSPGMAAPSPGLCRSSPSGAICRPAEGALGPTIQTPVQGGVKLDRVHAWPWVAPAATGLALRSVPRSSTLGPGRPARDQRPSLPARPALVRSGDMKSVLKRRERVMCTCKHTAFSIPGHNPPTPAISTNSPKAYREETPHNLTGKASKCF